MDRSHPSPGHRRCRCACEPYRERERSSTVSCQYRNEVVPHFRKWGFCSSCSSTTTTLGTASRASNHLNLQGLDALKASITGGHDGMRPMGSQPCWAEA